ncbi:class II D-tagatose-bisphosphate aldolase non-catalytic subunit [Candidatus Neomarinimicrobiota bacterium]
MIKKLSNSEIILGIIKKHKSDGTSGIYSICSSNKYVLKAAINYAKMNNSVLLIEATSNQVDQFGGYMGMVPKQFREYIINLLDEANYGEENIILGGDHLGPNTWQNLPVDKAMEHSKHLISEYVKAGFKKIHLDTSFICADDKLDKNGMLPKEIISHRAAELCKVAEDAVPKSDIPGDVVYVIGTEVPKPGGMDLTGNSAPEVSTIESTEETIKLSKSEFEYLELQEAWNRVVAVVTQPGVEFGDKEVFEYNPTRSKELTKFIENYDNLVYEAHSTDYQSPNSLKKLVVNHFAVLKVGPALTFAFREILFKLEELEFELSRFNTSIKLSYLSEIVENEMLKNPKYWINHYSGTKNEIENSRIYSLSDRIRYYWSNPKVSKSIEKLFDNLSGVMGISDELLEKYLPKQYFSYKEGMISNDPESLINNYIQQVIIPYSSACGMSKI